MFSPLRRPTTTECGKTPGSALAANKYVYRGLAAGLHGVNRSVSGMVSGQSRQCPQEPRNFRGLVVCMGAPQKPFYGAYRKNKMQD